MQKNSVRWGKLPAGSVYHLFIRGVPICGQRMNSVKPRLLREGTRPVSLAWCRGCQGTVYDLEDAIT